MKIEAQRCMLHPDDEKWVMDKIHKVLFETGQLVHGEYTKHLENVWADFCGRKHAVAMNSCTTALEVAVRALGIPKENGVIVVPTNTYGATAMACQNAGYEIRLVDIEEDLMMDIHKIDWDNVAGVVFVAIGGNVPPRVHNLEELCEINGVPLIIDAAHAHGSLDATTYGDAWCFSFYATKLMTMGEGGMLVTDDGTVDDFARLYRRCGKSLEGMEWEHVFTGSKFTLTEVQAVIGLSQMWRIMEYMGNRDSVAKIYNEKFDPIYYPGGNYYKYIVRGKPILKVKDITLPSPVYAKPLHQHMFIDSYEGTFPVAEKVCPDHFCLNIFNNMSIEEAEYVRNNVDVRK